MEIEVTLRSNSGYAEVDLEVPQAGTVFFREPMSSSDWRMENVYVSNGETGVASHIRRTACNNCSVTD